MFEHLLVVAPAALFIIALALVLDLPQRLLNGLARPRPRRLAQRRGG